MSERERLIVVILRASDLDASLRFYREVREEPWGTTARYADPDGNVVGVTSR